MLSSPLAARLRVWVQQVQLFFPTLLYISLYLYTPLFLLKNKKRAAPAAPSRRLNGAMRLRCVGLFAYNSPRARV